MVPQDIEQVLRCEAAHLDDRRWDDWLALFTRDCEFWVPAWKDNERLNEDPQTELSHIYYASREGLADRITRLTSRTAIASRPLPRSVHLCAGQILTAPPTDEAASLRTNWVSHVYFPRNQGVHTFFGTAHYALRKEEGRWLISRKKVVLANDYIPTLIDIYCI